MQYLMAIDCGSTVVKAVIFSLDGKEIAIGSAKPDTLYPKPGWTERNVQNLWQNVTRAIRSALENSGLKPQAIAGLAVTGHGNGLYCFDAHMNPSRNGILSLDSRTSETLAVLQQEETWRKVHPITGNQIWAAATPVLLRWVKDHEPEVFRQTSHICMVKDYVKYRLTGELSTDHTDFTGAGLADTAKISYAKEIFEAFGVAEVYDMLPPMLDPWTVAGKITREAGRATGLAEGTPVAAGGMDIDLTPLGCGCLDQGQMCIIVGTWSINGIILEKPMIHPEMFISSSYCVPNRWYICDASA